MLKLDMKIPKIHMPIFTQKDYVFAILYGGRDSAKTGSFIRYIIQRGIQERINVLCVREYQNSIEASVYKELKMFIIENNLSEYYIVKHDRIVGTNGTEIIFKGIERDPMSLKGIPKIHVCFVEEAETLRQESWDILLPTLYKYEHVKILVAFNPRERNSPTYQLLVENHEQLPQPMILIHCNYDSNPFITKLSLQAIEKMKKYNYSRYEHIYLGVPLDITDNVIYKGCFSVEYKEYNKLSQVRYGMDFGFSKDHFACLKVVIIDKDTIYIEKELYEIRLLPRHIKSKIVSVFGNINSKKIYADSARPDTIAELKADGMNVVAAYKGKGSVESGIEFLQGKNIIVNPDCKNTIFELHNYKFEQDKDTGDVLSKPIDKHNHLMDALRYAFTNEIQGLRRGLKISSYAMRALGAYR